MATRRQHRSVCTQPGCPNLTYDSRCPDHYRDPGYNHHHERLRRAWARRMTQGEPVTCSRCGEPINPDQPWHLDHTDDRTAYHGPAHQTCNSRAHADIQP